MQRGFTLVELVMAIALAGALLVMVITRAGKWLDRLAVDRAAQEIVGFYQIARFSAIYRSNRVRVELGPDTLRAVYEGVADSTFLTAPGPGPLGVAISTSRSQIWLHPNGIGAAGANTKIILRRGTEAESLTTSRVGRMRRWR